MKILTAIGLLLALSCTPALADVPTATVLIKRGEAALTLADMDAYVSEAPAELRAGLLSNLSRKEQILTQLMVLETLAQEAIDAGLLDDPLTQARVDLARTRFLAQLRTEQLQQSSPIDAEALARERYTSNPDRYLLEETVTVRHILVEARNRSERAAEARIAEVVAKLEAGTSFEQLVTEYSDDAGSVASGGLIPASARSNLDKAFSDAAFDLAKPGDRTGPVRSSFGYHIIELVEKTPERSRTFDEVREDLVNEIRAEHAERILRDHINEINSRPADINDDVLATLPERYRQLYAEPGVQKEPQEESSAD